MITLLEEIESLNPSISIIPLTHGKFALVDPELYSQLKHFTWRAVRSSHCWYAVRRIQHGAKTITIKMHRAIAKTPEYMVCHHRNGDPLDNRLRNLKNMYPLEHTVHHQIYRHHHQSA